MESTTTTMISNPALRIPPRGAASSSKRNKLLFCLIFVGCCSILAIYYDANKLNSLSYISTITTTTTTTSSTIVQEVMHATPALNVPIQKASSTAEQEGGAGDINKKIIQEQEQQTAQSAERKRIGGSHNVNKNVINDDGAASNGTTTIIAAVVEEQAEKYSLLADKNDTNSSSSIVTTSTDTSTSNSTSTTIRPPLQESSSTKRNEKFISYELVKDLPFRKVYDVVGQCDGDDFMLPEPFQAPGLLDFSTLIDTNLNILYVGDSVGMQFTQILQEATHPIKREVIRYSYCCFHENSYMALTPSGGTVAGVRVTGLMTNKTRDKIRWCPPTGGGGWQSRDIREMKRLVHHWRPTKTIDNILSLGQSPCEEGEVQAKVNENATFPSKEEYPCEEQGFDVVVHQFAPGWQQSFYKAISWSVIDEMVNTAFDYLGASTVILQTIQFMNNVENIAQLIEVNNVIWKYARDFQAKEAQRKSKDGRKRRVVVMDMYAYTISLVLQNSMAIGVTPNDSGVALQRQLRESTDFDIYLNVTMSLEYLFENATVTMTKKGKVFSKKKGHVCADANCDKKSRITADGQHWCTKSTGGRINAALACLLRCSFGEEAKADKTAEEMKQCEWRCNKKYMSLAPLPWDNAEEIEVNFNMVDLTNKKLRIQNNSIALRNY